MQRHFRSANSGECIAICKHHFLLHSIFLTFSTFVHEKIPLLEYEGSLNQWVNNKKCKRKREREREREISTYHTSWSQRNKSEAFLPTISLNIQSLRENKRIRYIQYVEYPEEKVNGCCIAGTNKGSIHR